jgi:hypothetical protein
MTPGRRSNGAVRYFKAITRLSRLVSRPGGISAERAVANASRRIEKTKDEYIDGLHGLIAQLVRTEGNATLPTRDKLDALDGIADQIINLAGTFGYSALQEAAVRLCDLTRGLRERAYLPAALVAIPVRSIHLLSPRAAEQDPASIRQLLEELDALLRHVGVEKPAAS